jgi:hypothetical protein
MTQSQRRELATLLGERVRDKADKDDLVGMFRAASLLDQVNEELQEAGAEPVAADSDPTPAPSPRRIFVKG